MNDDTRYEISATREGEPAYLIGFADQRTRAALLDAVRRLGFDLAIWLGLRPGDSFHCPQQGDPTVRMGQWLITFTARTNWGAEPNPLPHVSSRPEHLWAPVKVVQS